MTYIYAKTIVVIGFHNEFEISVVISVILLLYRNTTRFLISKITTTTLTKSSMTK